MDAEEHPALRVQGLHADDPAVILAIDLVRWEMSLAGDDRGEYGNYRPQVYPTG
jgi:hypothetical protein